MMNSFGAWSMDFVIESSLLMCSIVNDVGLISLASLKKIRAFSPLKAKQFPGSIGPFSQTLN